jgi:hypothetical protein
MYFNEQLSPLNAQQQFAESQNQYIENLMSASTGDVSAIGDFQKYAEQYLAQAKNMFGFGGDYSAIWQGVMNQANALAPEAGVTNQPASSTDITVLTEEVTELKEILARILEQGNTLTQEQTTQLITAIVQSSGDQIRATTTSSVLTVKA